MDITAFLQWLEATRLATGIRDSLYFFPLIESTHVFGLALVFGTIAIIDLRLLGIASTERPFTRMWADILKWTWAAFALTALTGALMFITNARVYYHNVFFQTKMLLLVLTGVNMLVFDLTARRTVDRWDNARSVPRSGKIVAAMSIAMWIGIIFMGRIIGFTTTRAGVATPPPSSVNFDDFLNGTPAAPTQPGSSGTPATPPRKK